MPRSLDFEYILTPEGIQRHKRVLVDDAGVIEAIDDAQQPAADGWFALPGMPNAHSHAFQRSLAGYGEAKEGNDSFWTWREVMYRLAGAIDPDDLYAIARRAYADMLCAGYTSVGEFHYLHHLPDGGRSDAMGRSVIAAARDAGIRIVFLPVYYRRGGFSGAALPEQQRFLHGSPEEFLDHVAQFDDVPCGIAPHSLRAVDPDELARLVRLARDRMGEKIAVHMHLAEQQAEVDECLARLGDTPLQSLTRRVAVDAHWSLIHGTHLSAAESEALAQAGATLVLCPLTEAYLGDGIFDAVGFVEAGGLIAVGSDSNVRIDAIEELRWLEYGQRLARQSRGCLATADGIGMPLWSHCARAGARSLSIEAGAIAPGRYADLVVLKAGSSALGGVSPERVPDAWLTGGSREDIEAVFVGGERRVAAGVVSDAGEVAARFRERMHSLLSRVELA